jgi:hypothetical protein
MKNFCTYFDYNYLDRGLALHESMGQHCQPFNLWVLALDDRCEDALRRLSLDNVTIVSPHDFITDDLRAAQGNRSRHEWIWTLTPWWMLHVLNQADVPYLSYVDADCYFFGDARVLRDELFDAEIAITPHRFSPSRRWMAKTAGLYNVGLVFARRTWTGQTCLQDWGARCLECCEQATGADQGYWDELLSEYGGHAIQHRGVDLAPWNQAEQYTYSLRGGRLHVDGDPLVMYHFHKRLEPGFELDPFVKKYVYPPYAEALGRAQEKIGKL